MPWANLSLQILDGGQLDRAAALGVLQSRDDELLTVLQSAFTIRRRYFGMGISLHVIRNAKSGDCSEDCAYCSQSATATTDITGYELQTVLKKVEGWRGGEMSRRKGVRRRGPRGPPRQIEPEGPKNPEEI